MRLSFFGCRACGHDDVVVLAREEKNYKGQVLRYAEWSTCPNCKLTRMVTPWTDQGTATPSAS
jgi:hypothetical protein